MQPFAAYTWPSAWTFSIQSETTYNWEKAVAAGMAEAGEEFSGKVDFIKTQMIWPITHMVAPSEDALTCNDCHSSNGDLSAGRMKSVPGLKKRLRFKYQP